MSLQKKYIAIKDVESYNTWLEFLVQETELTVSIMRSDEAISQFIITRSVQDCTYPAWRNIVVSRDEFKNELIIKTQRFIHEVMLINVLFLQSQRIKRLVRLLEQVKAS